MGLSFPHDLEAWRRWQERRHLLRWARNRLAPPRATPLIGWLGCGDDPDILIAADSIHASSAAALLAPLTHLDPTRVAVMAPAEHLRTLADRLPGGPWRAHRADAELRLRPRVVAALGHYAPVGATAYRLALARSIPFVIVQHGLLTPLAPPLAPGSQLLAWTPDDARFYRSGRTDVTATAVGSQLLWQARDRIAVNPDEPLRYLGQLHGAELRRSALTRAAYRFCRQTGAHYRPHPSEVDRLSRITHASWVRSGITLDRSGVPLTELRAPVVSVFSTGVLETAARGLPAWVDFPNPPKWLGEFWDRYGMRRYGGDPTSAPPCPDVEPAAAVAAFLGTA